MPKMRALTVQHMIAVPDREVICHGYTPNMGEGSNTLDVWFEKGQLVRAETDYKGNPINIQRSDYFEVEYLTANVKRWYEGSVHPVLRQLYETFNDPFNVTPGGHKVESPPIDPI